MQICFNYKILSYTFLLFCIFLFISETLSPVKIDICYVFFCFYSSQLPVVIFIPFLLFILRCYSIFISCSTYRSRLYLLLVKRLCMCVGDWAMKVQGS